MSKRPEGRVDRPTNSLAELQLSELDLDSVMGHIGKLGLEALEGWDAVGASLVRGEKVATYGITDDRVREIDQAQYDSGRGPCVDALKTGDAHYFDGTVVEPRWRQFAETAGDAGIYSVLSFPLKAGGESLGALNFYSEQRDALRPGQREEGWVFASQAAVTLANAKAFEARSMEIEQLREGLQTRTMIGQATGLLMAQEGLTSDEAFQKLVHVSQNANIKLRDVAQRYVQAWETTADRSA